MDEELSADEKLVLSYGESEINRFEVPLLTEISLESTAEDEAEIRECEAKVCTDRVSMADCGNGVAHWLATTLNVAGCRLLRKTDRIQRLAKPNSEENQPVSLANVAQFLLLHWPSIRYLHKIIVAKVPSITEEDLVLRFRGNLVVDGGVAFEEDSWTKIRIGNVTFKVVAKCHRCQMICIDQNTGEKDVNILTSLRDLREGTITFGVYLQVENCADDSNPVLKVGDSLAILS